MEFFERTLLHFLSRSRIKMEVTGFDLDGFSEAMHWQLRHKLDRIEHIAFEDTAILSDAEKIAEIKACFEEDYDARE